MTNNSPGEPPIDKAAKIEWIETHTLEFLYNNAIPAALGSLAVSCLLSWVIFNTENFYYLVPWVFVCFVIALLRGILVFYYRSHKKEVKKPLWFNYFRLVNLVSGVVVGCAAWLFISYASTSKCFRDNTQIYP